MSMPSTLAQIVAELRTRRHPLTVEERAQAAEAIGQLILMATGAVVVDHDDDPVEHVRRVLERTRTAAAARPCQLRAVQALRWAEAHVPGAEGMTYAELFDAIQHHPDAPLDLLPDSAETFAAYLRQAGQRRRAPAVFPVAGGSIVAASELDHGRREKQA